MNEEELSESEKKYLKLVKDARECFKRYGCLIVFEDYALTLPAKDIKELKKTIAQSLKFLPN